MDVAWTARRTTMAGWKGADAWGALHAPDGASGPASVPGRADRRDAGDRPADPRGCTRARRWMKVVFAVERREPHMVRPRSALLWRASGVSRGSRTRWRWGREH